MTPTMDLDMRQWQQAARELFATSKRSLPDFVNGQALGVAAQAIKQTKKADRARIEFELGQVATGIKQVTRGKNAGKFRKSGRVLRDDSLAARIVAARFRDTGKWIAQGSTLEERAKRLITNRIRTTGLVRAGWLPALRKLTSVVRQKPERVTLSSGGARQIGRDKGDARPARWRSGVILAEIENAVPALYRGTSDEAEDGLRKALRIQARDMIDTLARRLKKDWKPQGAK